MLALFLKLFFLVLVILLVVTIVLIRNSVKKLKNYRECTGTIMRFSKIKSPARINLDHRHRIAPVIEYKVHGKTYEFFGNYYSSWMKVGQEIQIMYHEEEPSKATVKKGLYVAPLVTGILTLGFASAFVVFIILKSKGILDF